MNHPSQKSENPLEEHGRTWRVTKFFVRSAKTAFYLVFEEERKNKGGERETTEAQVKRSWL